MPTEDQMIKRDIVNATIGLYLKDSSNIKEKKIAEKSKISEEQFYRFFKNKKEVLHYFYSDCVVQYQQMARDIEGFENATLEEKVSHFIYMMFDIFQPNRKFMEKTFDSLILMRLTASPFQKEVEKVFEHIADGDYSVSAIVKPVVANPFAFDIFARQYFLIIKFWLSDNSENYQNTMALVDKLVSFFTEAVQTRIPEKALDLFKYVVIDNVHKIPFIGKVFK
jgi:AcrR family transcriptional regulator